MQLTLTVGSIQDVYAEALDSTKNIIQNWRPTKKQIKEA